MITCELCNKKMKPLGLASHLRFCTGKICCLQCNNEIIGRRRKFCTIICHNLFQKNRQFSDEHRDKISFAKKGKKLSEEHKQKLSIKKKLQKPHAWTLKQREQQSIKRKEYLVMHPEKHPNALCRGKKSYPQQKLAKSLIDLGFNVIVEFTYKSYWVDIMLDEKLAIEVDGEYWHKNRQLQDAKKTKCLLQKYEVYRCTAKEVLHNESKVLEDIKILMGR